MGIDLFVDPGSFLAASPELLDPNFARAVVLICQHTSAGAYGLVLNRPSEFCARDVLPAHEFLRSSGLRAFVGGPVGLETLQILHRVPELIGGGEPITDDLWLGGDLDDVGRLARDDPERAAANVRLFLGYSGWGEGQLETELASCSWLPAPASAQRAFEVDAPNLWRDVVRALGPEYRALADEPPDPNYN